MSASSIAVVGAGSWGTALAIHLARNNKEVYLWGRDEKHLEMLKIQRNNERYLPEINFPPSLHVEKNLAVVLSKATDVLIAVPSHAFRTTLNAMSKHAPSLRIICATKGLDPKTNELLHEVVHEIMGDLPLAILSGPSFAKEVAQGLPTAITIASTTKQFAEDLISDFHNKNFRVYTTDDIIGVEIGGAIKNVLAVAVGIADGLGFGANARSALITRGLAEVIRLGTALGGRLDTFMGLSGLGDLILTCTDNQSRNRRFGLALGEGRTMQAALTEIGQVVEGIQTAAEIHKRAKEKAIDLPICEQVYRVLYENLPPAAAVNNLLSREPKVEGF